MKKALAAIALGSAVAMTTGCSLWDPIGDLNQKQAGSQAVEPQTLVPEERDTDPEPPAGDETGPEVGANEAVLAYIAQLEAAQQESSTPQESPTSVDTPSARAGTRHEPPVTTATSGTTGASGGASRTTEAPGTALSEKSGPQTNKPVDLESGSAGGTVHGSSDRLMPPRVLAVSVSTKDSLESPSAPAVTLSTNQGLDTAVSQADTSLANLIRQARTELAEDPSNVKKQWQLSLLQLAAGEPVRATELSPEIARQERTLMSAAISSIEACGRALTSRVHAGDDALTAVDSLRTLLQDTAEVAIPVVALCSKVVTFGVYDELPDGALIPYQANRVIVYFEIDHFMSQQEGSGAYRTSLSNRLELFTSDGRSLWAQEEANIEDFSKQRRDDFFLAQLVMLPANMGPGEYTLKVTVTDLLASNTNEAIHRFRVGS